MTGHTSSDYPAPYFPPFCDRKGAPDDCGTVNDFTLMVVRWDLLGAY